MTLLSRVIGACAMLLALCAGAQAAPAPPASAAPTLKAGTFDPPRPAPDLAGLRASDGKDLTLARLRGKLVLMSFGFTNCAAVCPTTLATLAEARRTLGPAAADVQVLFITVDPQ